MSFESATVEYSLSRFNATIRLVVVTLLMLGCTQCAWPQLEDDSVPALVKRRMTLQTPDSDELLFELEQDYLEFLKNSEHARELLQAEQLLAETNDNTHWTNYAQATKMLRATNDVASIPLLLRYIVIHSQRSSRHVMIPEYCRTISLISGKELENMYESGPDLESRMRGRVQEVVTDWWRESKSSIVTDRREMDDSQLQVIVAALLKQVQRDGDFTGSGGKRDSAYRAYHNVYYRLLSDDAIERHAIEPLVASMVPLVLSPIGFRQGDNTPSINKSREFPFASVVILAELAKNGNHKLIQEIANDDNQNSTVRMACALALFRAKYPFDTELMLGLLEDETGLENKLINLLSLRWGDQQAVPVLLKYMKNENSELATAAACALGDAKPPEAIPVFKKIFDRQFDDAPLLMLGALSEYDSPEAREILRTLLIQALNGERNEKHLYRILYAFADSWNVPRNAFYHNDDRDYKSQARLALAYGEELEKQAKVKQIRLTSLVESLRTQLKVAEEIHALRQSEYKRLLGLQGDEVVTPADSQKAHDYLKTISAEVESIRLILQKHEIELQALNEIHSRKD